MRICCTSILFNLNTSELVDKNWLHQTDSESLYERLLQLQDVLNFNIQKLNLLVKNLYIASYMHSLANQCFLLIAGYHL